MKPNFSIAEVAAMLPPRKLPGSKKKKPVTPADVQRLIDRGFMDASPSRFFHFRRVTRIAFTLFCNERGYKLPKGWKVQ